MEITTLSLVARDATSAFAMALVCRAAGCRTGEEDRDDRLVLHVVGPKSVLIMLETLLPRLAHLLPKGPRSEAIGYAVAVAERLVEHILIPDGAAAAVEAEFQRDFEVLEDLADESMDPDDYGAGRAAGLAFTLFPIPIQKESWSDKQAHVGLARRNHTAREAW